MKVRVRIGLGAGGGVGPSICREISEAWGSIDCSTEASAFPWGQALLFTCIAAEHWSASFIIVSYTDGVFWTVFWTWVVTLITVQAPAVVCITLCISYACLLQS